jgi:hypothetical protein
MIDLPISPLTGSRRAFSRNVLQRIWLVASEKALLKFPLLEGLLLVLPGIVRERDDKALVGKEFGGDPGTGVHHSRTNEEALFHAVQQGVSEGGLAVLAAEGTVGIQQQAAFALTRIAGARIGTVEPAEVVARRGAEAEFVAHEVVEDGAGIAADGAVRFVGDDEIEVGRRKELLVFIIGEQGLPKW